MVLFIIILVSLAFTHAWAQEEGDTSVFGERPIVRMLREFKTQAGPIVPRDSVGKSGAQSFGVSKAGVNFNGEIWFENNHLVVDSKLETEGQSFIPQRVKLWDPSGRSFESEIDPQAVRQETGPADPSEPPVAFSFGFGVSAPVRRSRHKHKQDQHSQSSQSESCYDCTGGSPGGTEGGHHEPEHHEPSGPRFTPRVGITFTPTSTPPPPKPNYHKFPSPPCPRRLKGWSIGTIGPGPGRPQPLVAFLKEPPGAFVRTSPCQILVVMSIPPGKKGAEDTMRQMARSQGLTFIRSLSLPSINTLVALVEFSGPTPLGNILPGLQSLSNVQYAQANHLYRTATYNDPLSDLQYGPKLIDADRAHQVATGESVSVAIIDTSIDSKQPDLKGKVSRQVDLIGPDPPGLTGIHGTLMSGVIVATENNGVGGFGVAPHVKVIGLKACQPLAENPTEAACSSESIARALDYAISKKVKVINMSLGGPPDRLVETLIKKAASKNIVLVAAAGNEGPKAPPSYPAAYESVLGVSAVDLDDELYSKSNMGDYVDLAAPGVDIVSTLPGDRFNVFSGTSIATAHVSAAAALLLQAKPGLSAAEVADALEATAVDLGPRGRDPQFGAGRINACRALERVTGKSICP